MLLFLVSKGASDVAMVRATSVISDYYVDKRECKENLKFNCEQDFSPFHHLL